MFSFLVSVNSVVNLIKNILQIISKNRKKVSGILLTEEVDVTIIASNVKY